MADSSYDVGSNEFMSLYLNKTIKQTSVKVFVRFMKDASFPYK
jgi:hypothetical protein